MADQFSKQVEQGLKLSKRISYGRSPSMSAPEPATMDDVDSSAANLPTGPMAYAVIKEPSVVDNPDIPSYQPYVHGPCLPPALIPLHMHGVVMEVECCFDTAFVTVSGTWRVHCVTAGKSCQCRIAIPMADQGSVLGVEINTSTKSYYTQLITMEDAKDPKEEKAASKSKDGWWLKRHTYVLSVPQVSGGSYLSVKVRWSKKLVYQDGEFLLNIPFSFPAYVVPVVKKVSKSEKITLNVNSGVATQILCKATSHPLKEVKREAGRVGFFYEADVQRWSTSDFVFSYSVDSNDIFGGVLLQSPSLNDFDQRQMFAFYLFPGNNPRKVFKKEIVFLVDISASMKGSPIEIIKETLTAALFKLNPEDSFNIIAFNNTTILFSPSIELATTETIEKATQWIDAHFIAEGGTNMLLPLNQAMEMVASTIDTIPLIFLVTDGTVEDEKEICNVMKGRLNSGTRNSPRICTFGIGSYCNHYFLQMLAQIGRGHYDSAYDVGSIAVRMQRLVQNASSIILANITIDALEHVASLELSPLQIPDLLSERPLVASGRFHGKFPDSVKVSGILADSSNFLVDVKVQTAKNFPIDTVFAKRQIDTLTARAWLSGSKQLEEKVAKLSMQTGFPSEYTSFILVQKTDKMDAESDQEKMYNISGKNLKKIFLRGMGVGFGNLIATTENLAPGAEEPKPQQAAGLIINAASSCCGRMVNTCCCMCCLQACSRINNQCSIALTQLCTALACFELLNCCIEICSSCD